MLEEGRTCEDVLTQLLAARSGLERSGLLILDRHLADCVLEGTDLPADVVRRLSETLRLWGRHSASIE